MRLLSSLSSPLSFLPSSCLIALHFSTYSRKYPEQQSRPPPRQRRDRALAQSQLIPRRTCEEGHVYFGACFLPFLLSVFSSIPSSSLLTIRLPLIRPFVLCCMNERMNEQAMAASANPILQSKEVRDPTLFCTAYKRARFYMFTRAEPEYVLSSSLLSPILSSVLLT